MATPGKLPFGGNWLGVEITSDTPSERRHPLATLASLRMHFQLRNILPEFSSSPAKRAKG
jgi:hypothetical protein